MSDSDPRLLVEVADPGYGPGLDPGDAETAPVDADVEGIPWGPITPAPRLEQGRDVAFIDGIQQTEAWLTVTGGPDGLRTGAACAVGAGVVVAQPGRPARIAQIDLRRVVIMAGDRLLHLPSRGGFSWTSRCGAAQDAADLARAVGEARRDLEHRLAESHATTDRLLVVDGRLSYLRDSTGPVMGAIKSHHRMYLTPEQAEVVTTMAVGQRTPLFGIGGDRLSWYQRLPVPTPAGWSGVLRGEVARSVGVAQAQQIADRAAAELPFFAGRPHRDPRAPQNLAPIGALEQRLRHRLGERRLALRAVRQASIAATLGDLAVPVRVDEPPEEMM